MKTQDQIIKALGNIEGKIDGINKRLDLMNGSLGKHETRINDNEHKIDIATGKATAIGALLGVIGACIIAAINFIEK